MSDIEIIWLTLYNTLNRTEDKKNVQTSTNQSISPEKKNVIWQARERSKSTNLRVFSKTEQPDFEGHLLG